MKSTLVTSLAAVAAVSITAFASRSAMSSGQSGALVRLQGTPTGSSQAGHVNIAGTIKAGQFQGGGAGLTSVNADLIDGLNSTAFLQSIPVPLTLTGTNSSHIIYGENNSTSSFSTGVFGYSSAGSGNTFGGRFQTTSTSGTAVFAWATAGSGFTTGVFAETDSPSGAAVRAISSAATGTNYGLSGQCNSAAGYGVYSNGRFSATGTKAFRIDHPDDPENRYLMHYCTESPEVLNAYRGIVVLDRAGEAIVELPAYFAKINKTPTYTLTAVGAPMPTLHVAKEIDEAALNVGAIAEPGEEAPLCSFRIAGGTPGKKVCWRVEAVRNDRWVQKHGAPVEVEKDGLEMGTYQHPDLYGASPEMGLNYQSQLRK